MNDPAHLISMATRVRASENVLVRTAAGETVLLDLDSEEFFGLDGVGARVFELIAEPLSVSAVVDVLLSEYEVDRKVLHTDITNLLVELSQRGLIVTV